MRTTGAVRLLAAAATVATALAAPAARAGCASVRSRDGWTLADLPKLDQVANIDRERLLHYPGNPTLAVVPGGAPARRFVSTGFSLFRSTDSGCAWQRVLTVDPSAAAGTDPALLAATADPEYTIRAVATRLLAPGARPVAGQDPVYVLLGNSSNFGPGIAANAAGATPFVLARSADGGSTWHSQVLSAALPGATSPTPVLGSGDYDVTVVVPPSDPRTAYLRVAVRDPRALAPDPTTTLPMPALYVTHDTGATWSFATALPMALGSLVADPVAAGTLYGIDSAKGVESLTLGKTVAAKPLLTAVKDEQLTALDVTRTRGKPATLLVTSLLPGPASTTTYRIHLSADGGRSWRTAEVPVNRAASGGAPVGIAAWLTGAGDVLVVSQAGGYGAYVVMVQRWSAARRRWLARVVQRLPVPPGYASVDVRSLVPADTGHRLFAVTAWQDKPPSVLESVAGVYDSATA